MNRLCVVIPIYKTALEEMEERSIERTCEILLRRDIFFVAPEGLQLDNYDHFLNKENINVEYFAPKFFQGISGYNKLMLEKRFYERFSAYDYMLIAQPDAYILSGKDELDGFMKKGYQYWGAPWNPPLKIFRLDLKGARHFEKFLKPVICQSGNGGFSLRHISSTIKLLNEKKITAKLWCNNYNEDGFFAYFGHSSSIKWFNCPPLEETTSFALEADMKEMLALGKDVFAVHAWEKMLKGYCNLKKYIRPIDLDE